MALLSAVWSWFRSNCTFSCSGEEWSEEEEEEGGGDGNRERLGTKALREGLRKNGGVVGVGQRQCRYAAGEKEQCRDTRNGMIEDENDLCNFNIKCAYFAVYECMVVCGMQRRW